MEPSGGSLQKSSEAGRSLAIAEKLLSASDLIGSKRFAERALSADPDLHDDRADQILAVADVLLRSQNHRVNNHPDWYSLLHLPHPNIPADNNGTGTGSPPPDFSNLLKRSYRRLALLLHPDRNRYPAAANAFQLVVDAYIVLSDPSKKSLFDAEILRMSAIPGASAAAAAPPEVEGTSSSSSSFAAAAAASFWTMCPFCCHVYQYPRPHQGRSLRCQTCTRVFEAVEMPAPPPIVPGTDTYRSTWGFFPLGFPASVHTDWKPFVPMFPWTGSGSSSFGTCGAQQTPPSAHHRAAPPANAAAAAVGKGKKKMARKKVLSGQKKKVLASETQNPRFDGGNGGVTPEKKEEEEEDVVTAKGINMNEEARVTPEGARVEDDLEMLIDLDAANDVLGNLENLPFLRGEDIHNRIP